VRFSMSKYVALTDANGGEIFVNPDAISYVRTAVAAGSELGSFGKGALTKLVFGGESVIVQGSTVEVLRKIGRMNG